MQVVHKEVLKIDCSKAVILYFEPFNWCIFSIECPYWDGRARKLFDKPVQILTQQK